MGGRHFAAADGLRFASALMVVGFHAGTCYAIAPSTLSAAALRGLDMPTGGVGWTWWGWVGVELFFTLSGFVIAASAIGSTSAGFLRRRALRLYPAAWIAATITLALFALSQAAPVALLVPRWIAAVLLLPTGPWIDASYWTLAIECSFYLLIAAVLHRRSDGAAIERVGAALTLWSGCFWAVYVLRNPMGDALMHVRLIELLLLPAGAQFGLGIAIWALLHREVTARRIAAAIGAYGVSCVGVICHAADRAAAMHLKNDVAVPLLVFTLGVVVLLSARQLQPRFAAPAMSRWMAGMGLATYPLYLLHQDGGALLFSIIAAYGVPGWAGLLLAQAGILLIACGIALSAEPWLRHVLQGRRTAAATIGAMAPRRASM